MADKNIDIKINTTANTTGAKQAGASIQDLENKLEQLQQELRRVPVAGEDFTRLSGQIKTVQNDLAGAEIQARKLGATTGRNGNAGMAMLEFSRLTEDAQYGLRGILNNIPTLVMQLGGTAGLAGALSLAAVAITQLWERFGSGSKQAGDDLEALKERAKDVKDFYDGLAKKNIEFNTKDAAEGARDLKNEILSIGQNAKLEIDKSSLESSRIEAEKRVALSRESLKLAELEAKALRDGNMTALQLTLARLNTAKNLLTIEYEAAELKRRDAEKAARSKLTTAVIEESRAVPGPDERRQDVVDVVQKIAGAEQILKRAIDYRLKQLAEAQKALEDAKNVAAITAGTDGELIASGMVVKAEERVKSLSKPGTEESDARQMIKTLTSEELPKAQEALKVSAEELLTFTRAVELAKSEFERVVSDNKTQGAAEKQIITDANRQINLQGEKDLTQVAAKELDDIATAAEKGGNAELKPAVEKIRAILQDGVITLDELKGLDLLMAQNNRMLMGLGGDITKQLEDANRAIDELRRQIQQIQATSTPTDNRTKG
jgi:hypothetical protein